MPRLTNKQSAFIHTYLANGFNATQAAIAAGYSVKTAAMMGSENLRKPHIAEVVQARLQQMAMPAEEALARLADIARGDISDFLDPETNAFDLNRARAAGKLPLVKRFTQTTVEGGIVTTRIELYDAQAALVQILNESRLNTGKATSRVDVTLNVDALTDDELARIATGSGSGIAGAT